MAMAGILASLVMVVGLSAAQAATSTLATTCSGSVASNTVTWSASTTGGVTPYAFLWSGTNIQGSTGTSITAAYGANGTYNASVAVTDASSSVANASCSAVVNSFPVPTSTPFSVTCSGSVVNNVVTWSANAAGGVSPYSFLWSGTNVQGSTSTSVVATYGANGVYNASVTATDASSSVATGSCSVVVNSFVTPTSTHTQVNVPPQLQVGPDGRFLARDMIVQSVGTNSFTGTIWGITYTVNVASTTNPVGWMGLEYYLRNGRTGGNFSMSQLQVGDQLGVSGWVSTGSPLVVSADVVRNYSLMTPRPEIPEMEMERNMNANGGMNLQGAVSSGENSNPESNSIGNRLNALMQQLQNLQLQYQNRFGGGNHGNGNSNGQSDN